MKDSSTLECAVCHRDASDPVTLVCCGVSACKECLDKYCAERASLLSNNCKSIPCLFCKASFQCNIYDELVVSDKSSIVQDESAGEEDSKTRESEDLVAPSGFSTPNTGRAPDVDAPNQDKKSPTHVRDSSSPTEWHSPLMLLSSIAGSESLDEEDPKTQTNEEDSDSENSEDHTPESQPAVATVVRYEDSPTRILDSTDQSEGHMPLLMLSSIADGERPNKENSEKGEDLNAVTEDDSTQSHASAPAEDQGGDTSPTNILDLTDPNALRSRMFSATPDRSPPRKGPRQLVRRMSRSDQGSDLYSPPKDQEWHKIRSFIHNFKSPEDPDFDMEAEPANNKSAAPGPTRRSRRIAGPSSNDAYIVGSPGPHDVVLGRGQGPMHHAGNIFWHKCLTAHVAAYQKAEIPECKKISAKVVAEIQDRKPPGRFVQKDQETGKWFEIPNKRAEEKTNRALYDLVISPNKGLLARSLSKSQDESSSRPAKKLKMTCEEEMSDEEPLSPHSSDSGFVGEYIPGEPHPHDVLLGRGSGLMKHEGNVWWRSLLSTYMEDYRAASRPERKVIAAKAVLDVQCRDPPGRFLERNAKTGKWEDIGQNKAEKKAVTAIRDMLNSGGPCTPSPSFVKPTEKPERPVKKTKEKKSFQKSAEDAVSSIKGSDISSPPRKKRQKLEPPPDPKSFVNGEPHEFDVVLGRGAGPMGHKGNVRWRNMLGSYLNSYANAQREERKSIAATAVFRIRSQSTPGRFLQQDRESGRWFDIGDKKAEKKASQGLRDMMDHAGISPVPLLPRPSNRDLPEEERKPPKKTPTKRKTKDKKVSKTQNTKQKEVESSEMKSKEGKEIKSAKLKRKQEK